MNIFLRLTTLFFRCPGSVQLCIGGIYSSLLMVNGVDYFGRINGYLHALK